MKTFKYTYEETGKEIVFQAEAEFMAIPTLAAELGCGCIDCQRGLNLVGDYVEVAVGSIHT